MPSGPAHAVVSAPAEAGADLDRGSLTAVLGCAELRVHAVRLPAGGSLTLPPEDERVVVPLAPADAVRRIGRAPPGEPWTIDADADVTLLVLFAPADRGSEKPRWLDLEAIEYAAPSTSAVATAHLTAELDCTGLKANARVLEPGQSVPLHTEGTQEELFVPLDEGGLVKLGDETVATPPGSVVRVAPDVPRSARNVGHAETEWLMFGAPPTGGPTDWDPGATLVDDGDCSENRP